MKKNQLGKFIPGDSIIHTLDPRTKIISITLIIIAVLINFQWYYLLLYIFLLVAAIYFSGIDPKIIYRSLRKIRYLLLLTLIFQAFLTDGEPLIQFWKLCITREGLEFGIENIFRLTILYLSSTLLIMTTSPIKLAAGIESLLSPLSKLKIPVHHFSMLISASLRFIPTFIEEAEIIKDAQKSRGAQFNSPKLMDKVKSNLAILIPLLAASLQRADDLAIAMESRCYTGHPNKIRIAALKMSQKDISLIFLILFLVIVGILINIV